MIVLAVVLWGLGLLVLAASAYLAVLAVLARPLPAPPPSTSLRFDVVVPAHDEEAGIGATLASLEALDYPPQRRRIFVVADNCTDGTAEVAMRAGAQVIVRDDAERRGKGYALGLAFERLQQDDYADAVVVVDADTLVSPNLLQAFAGRMAAGTDVLQAHHAVRNADASWRTRLMALAFALFHGVRSLARERLGLSVGLRGNGMGFTRGALRACPYDAHSLAEDVEYGIELARAGVRVGYVPEAVVQSEMPVEAARARSQRSRWEKGRFDLVRTHAPALFRDAAARRDGMLLDPAVDLVIPPFADLALAVLVGVAVSGAMVLGGAAPAVVLLPWAISLVALVVYLVRGILHARMGWGALALVAAAPAYLVWKLTLGRARWSRRSQPWVRTARKGEAR